MQNPYRTVRDPISGRVARARCAIDELRSVLPTRIRPWPAVDAAVAVFRFMNLATPVGSGCSFSRFRAASCRAAAHPSQRIRRRVGKTADPLGRIGCYRREQSSRPRFLVGLHVSPGLRYTIARGTLTARGRSSARTRGRAVKAQSGFCASGFKRLVVGIRT